MEETPDYYSYQRSELYPFIPQDIDRTLDVGCASGIFSEYLKKHRGCETWGIEVQTEVAEIAKTKLDKVLTGLFEEVKLQLPNKYFDCIFFNDVLEHMTYPEACLTAIKSQLQDGGYVVASIPNMRNFNVLKELLFQQSWEYKDEGILDRTHLRFFTKKSIINMFTRCGYTIERIEGINYERSSKICLMGRLPFRVFKDVQYKQFVVVASIK
ncbi:MAG: hypothetical protein RL662_1070 [Bacteroidota bacterium]|jgi:2-polyprenyl-3-methyl-5-hydroxy-6-metoxy-1,4-benzoquinol methylase